MRLIRRLARARLGRDVKHRAAISLQAEQFGSDDYGWHVYTGDLDARSIVYSFGVGEDVSFDLALIARFGLAVHAFDPTPKSIAWADDQDLPPAFQFHTLGIAHFDGRATFNAPVNPNFASYTMTEREGDPERAVAADVRRLSTIMSALGHSHIDVLKLDVEGAEYDVLTDIVTAKLDVRQILVEFHHAFDTISVEKTDEAIAFLRRHGYALFYVSAGGEDYSFVRIDRIAEI